MNEAALEASLEHGVELLTGPGQGQGLGHVLDAGPQGVIDGPVHRRADAANIDQQQPGHIRFVFQLLEIGAQHGAAAGQRVVPRGLGGGHVVRAQAPGGLLITGDQQLIAVAEGFIEIALGQAGGVAHLFDTGMPVAVVAVDLGRGIDQLLAAQCAPFPCGGAPVRSLACGFCGHEDSEKRRCQIISDNINCHSCLPAKARGRFIANAQARIGARHRGYQHE